MSDISNIYSNIGASYDSAYVQKQKDTEKAESNSLVSKSKTQGKTVGNPQLSEKGQKYYEELKKKFHNMEFVLVSEDQKEYAKSKAASFANKNKMVVLIDEAKIEKMAEDSSYRAQYESLIEKSAVGFTEMSNSIASTGADVKGYGMQVNDNGTVSYFAVLKKQGEAQSERIAEKRAEKQAEKKAKAKKEAKAEEKERMESARKARKSDKTEKAEESDNEVITANSLEELIQKLSDHVQALKSDSTLTEGEKLIGQNIDFSA